MYLKCIVGYPRNQLYTPPYIVNVHLRMYSVILGEEIGNEERDLSFSRFEPFATKMQFVRYCMHISLECSNADRRKIK